MNSSGGGIARGAYAGSGPKARSGPAAHAITLSGPAALHEFFGQVGATLADEIPGASFHVDADHDYGWGALTVRYLCPCGEVSRFAITARSTAKWGCHVRETADYLKETMRRHVRSEGNEPGF